MFTSRKGWEPLPYSTPCSLPAVCCLLFMFCGRGDVYLIFIIYFMHSRSIYSNVMLVCTDVKLNCQQRLIVHALD